MKKYMILFLLIGAVSCASVKTVFDYDKKVDFTQFKTYQLTKDDLEESVGTFNRERILTATETELTAKGLSKSDNPDLLVNAHIKSKTQVQATATSTGGYGAYGWYRGGGTTYIDYDEYTEGTLFITIAEADSETIIWQGAGSKTLDENVSADKREANINYAVKQILSNYPPAQ